MGIRTNSRNSVAFNGRNDESSDGNLVRLQFLSNIFKAIVQHLLDAAETAEAQLTENEDDIGIYSALTPQNLSQCGMRLMELLWREHISYEEFDAVVDLYPEHFRVCWHS